MPSFVDDQEDVFHCGKCKEAFRTLIEFLSHKREHITADTENMASQIIIRNENAKSISFAQPSNQIWIWNSANAVTECQNVTFSSDDDINREESVPCTRSVRYVQQDLVEQHEFIEEANAVVTTPCSEQPSSGPSVELTCSVCQGVFKKQFDLYLHFRSHTGEKPFQCMVCGRTFSHKSNLKKHMATHRVWPDGLSKTLPPPAQQGVGSDLGYSCPYCQKCLNTYSTFKFHLKEHGHQKVFKCIQKKCLAMFVDLDSLISHININHPVTEYHCHICSIKLFSLGEMSNHHKNHNPRTSKSNQVTKHTCMYCNMTFKKHDRLAHHLATASHINTCSHCNKSFVSERALRRHLVLHDDSKNLRCGICGMNFKTKSYLLSHMLTHSKEKNFTCTICNVKFTRKDILMRHIKIHQPNKKKPCPFRSHVGCMMEFTRTDKLNQHVNTHIDKLGSKKKTKRNIKSVEANEHSTIEIIIVPLPDSQSSDQLKSSVQDTEQPQ